MSHLIATGLHELRLLGRLLAACISFLAIATTATAEVTFDRHAIDPSFPVRDVLHGQFADAPTLLLLGDADDRTMFSVHTLEADGWREAHHAPLPDGAVLADQMSIAGRDRLVTFDGERLAWLDPSDWSFRPLAMTPLTTLYRGVPRSVALADIGRDVNGDGTDDLALPDFDGLWIVLQDDAGGFGEPVKLPAPPSMSAGNSVSFDLPETWPLDHDGDGRGDLAVVQDDHLIVFRDAQNDAEPVAIAVPGGLTHTTARAPTNAVDATRTLRELADYNGDGIADLAITTTKGEGPMEAETAVRFHFGRRDGGATSYDEEPASIVPTGSIGDIRMTDIDGDGRKDILAMSGEFSVGKIAMALMTGSISLDAAIHLMDADGFDPKPTATRKMKLGENNPGPAFADVNGDGRQDLVQVTEDGLEVLIGEDSARLFPKRALKVDVDGGEEAPSSVTGADVDGDGREDLVLRYGRDGAVGVLLSR